MSQENMGNIVYLTNSEYDTLVTDGHVTLASGEVVTYSSADTYITPEELATETSAGLMSSEDKVAVNTITNKVDKITTTSSYDRCYVVKANGTQGLGNIDCNNPSNWTIVGRNGTGQIVCATPTSNNNAATKKYVDDNLPRIIRG